MSRTDKTDPYFVKLHRYGIEDHDHSTHKCDYDPNENLHKNTRHRHWNSCSKQQRCVHYYNDNWFGQPKAYREESIRQHRVSRRKVKSLLHKGRYEDIDNRGTGRSSAIWNCA